MSEVNSTRNWSQYQYWFFLFQIASLIWQNQFSFLDVYDIYIFSIVIFIYDISGKTLKILIEKIHSYLQIYSNPCYHKNPLQYSLHTLVFLMIWRQYDIVRLRGQSWLPVQSIVCTSTTRGFWGYPAWCPTVPHSANWLGTVPIRWGRSPSDGNCPQPIGTVSDPTSLTIYSVLDKDRG